MCGMAFSAMCVALAFLTYFLGCDATLKPTCRTLDIVRAKPVEYAIDNATCRTSTRSPPYPCYSSFAVLEFYVGSANQTCLVPVATDVVSWDLAEAQAQAAYPLWVPRVAYVQKSSGECVSASNERRLARVGVVFFCLAAVPFACLFLLAVGAGVGIAMNYLANGCK